MNAIKDWIIHRLGGYTQVETELEHALWDGALEAMKAEGKVTVLHPQAHSQLIQVEGALYIAPGARCFIGNLHCETMWPKLYGKPLANSLPPALVSLDDVIRVLEARRQLYLTKRDRADPLADDCHNRYSGHELCAEAMEWAIADVEALATFSVPPAPSHPASE